MKKFIQLLGASLFLVFILQDTVLATGLTNYNELPLLNGSKCEHSNCKHSAHFNRSAYEILKNKYGVTEKDFEEAKSKGKTYFDIAKEKSVREIDFKAAIIEPKLKAIDVMISTGQLTKEKGEEMKSKVKESISKWDGKIDSIKKHKDCHTNGEKKEQES